MNTKEFFEFYEKLIEEEKRILGLKGFEYCGGNEDKFANFKRIAKELGLHPIEVLWVYATKHKDSITTFIKNKKVYSDEDIIGRIHDLRNYLALLAGLIEECRNLPEGHKWKLEKTNKKEELK